LKAWSWTLLWGLGWLVLMIVIGIVHTEVWIKNITPQQDAVLSHLYGRIAGVGVGVALALALVWKWREPTRQTAVWAMVAATSVSVALSLRGGPFGTREDVRSAAYLEKMAAEVNKQLPKRIDPETEMTKVSGSEGMVEYSYTLVNRAASELNGASLAVTVQPQITKAACTMPETRDNFLKKGIVLRYSYVDRSGVPVATFDVSPADCGL
jgi:hypothetical protein